MVTPEQAAALISTSTRTIYQLLEAGYIHFTETPERALLICSNSLLAAGATEDPQATVNRDAAAPRSLDS